MTALNDHPMFQAQWPEGVNSFCSVRHGGASKGPFESLNLGNHVQDDPADVSANRGTFAEHLGAKPVFLNQVHGWNLIELTDQTPDGTTADVCITQFSRLACTIMVADCLPVLFAEPSGQWVAAAHAGWRGLAGEMGLGVIEVAVNAMRDQLNLLDIAGVVVIGEGERDEAPMLYIGERVGKGRAGRAASDDRDLRQTLLGEICNRTGASPVQHIGKILVVYRENPQLPAATPKKRAARKQPRRTKRSFQGE